MFTMTTLINNPKKKKKNYKAVLNILIYIMTCNDFNTIMPGENQGYFLFAFFIIFIFTHIKRTLLHAE